MRKIRLLIGMPVICENKRIGRVVQVHLSNDLTRMEGIWIDAGVRGTRYISSESISMLGEVAVLTDDNGKRARCKSVSLFRRAVGTDGRRLGAITGAQIDEISFAVDALELSTGIWEDLLFRRLCVRNFTLNRENGDVIVDIAEIEKEGNQDVEGYGKRTDHGRDDRRFSGNDVRNHELAGDEAHERTADENG